MSRNAIIVSEEPKGHFIEGLLASGQTPKPGQCISLKSDGTYEAWNGAADGEQDEVIILLDDNLQGKTVDDAYADGARFFAYIPLPGDELMVLCANISGSGDTYPVAQKLIIDDGTGKAIYTTGTPEMEPFKVLVAPDSYLTADTLVLCRFTGC